MTFLCNMCICILAKTYALKNALALHPPCHLTQKKSCNDLSINQLDDWKKVAVYFNNQLIVLVIFQAKTSNIYWLQLLKCEALLLSFVIYRSKGWIFGFWTELSACDVAFLLPNWFIVKLSAEYSNINRIVVCNPTHNSAGAKLRRELTS